MFLTPLIMITCSSHSPPLFLVIIIKSLSVIWAPPISTCMFKSLVGLANEDPSVLWETCECMFVWVCVCAHMCVCARVHRHVHPRGVVFSLFYPTPQPNLINLKIHTVYILTSISFSIREPKQFLSTIFFYLASTETKGSNSQSGAHGSNPVNPFFFLFLS